MYKDDYRTIGEMRRTDDIMSRVRTVGGIRAFTSSPMAGACLAIVFLVSTTVVVSVRDVMSNIMAQAEWGGRLSYAFSSLLHSRFIVQALALLVLVSCTMVLFRSMRHLKSPLYFVGNFLASVSPLRFFRS